ncbi:hypothetical protein [Cellulomonas carbonis]|uniref:Uncharacterized protein n=1 Tax=Cellulomonas carbonis T26 TaxID=947969 RepID=A0A0A0BX19_9CELL|nr:hypothetical protein [Cellulomonas carbonis]KGM11694.1 hypothetical protein N868_07800 [Cellulomonas carbonis T26]GGB98984.1 hypothetical protein GCM10010972_09760 [Cellulomonas carbonis]
MTTTTNPDRIEPVRDDEYAVPLTGLRRTRHLTRLLEMRDMFARLSTERYCHSLDDSGDVFTLMANVEEEIAVLYPDVHAALFPTWVSQIGEAGHEPGQYNPRCGICRAHPRGAPLRPAA